MTDNQQLPPRDRLAVLYDADNPDGPDHDYFRALADESAAETIIDLGCGTGILTVTLAESGRKVIGIDPDKTMLNRARQRSGGDRVEWRTGTSTEIETDSADLVIMSGNVAMHVLGDQWTRTLHDISRGLHPGGRLAFETRNPGYAAWKQWNDPLHERDTVVGRLRESTETDPPNGQGVVTMHCHTEFLDTAETVDIDLSLQFRGLGRIQQDLAGCGLRVTGVWRDWSRTPFTGSPDEPLMVFEATASCAGSIRT